MGSVLGRVVVIGLAVLGAFGHAAQAADKVKLAVGQLGFYDTLIPVYADENGYFKERGIDLEWVKTAGGAETAQMLIANEVQFGIGIGVLSAITTYAKGAPIRIVSSAMVGTPETFWYVRADSRIKTVKDLDGATIAYSRAGGGIHLTLLEMASFMNLKLKLVSAGDISATRTQVMTGQIDAGWSVPPFALDLAKKGEVRVLFRGEIVEPLNGMSVRVNIANANWLAKNRDAARRFMMGYQRAIDWMFGEGQNEAIARFAKYNKLDPDLAREAAGFYKKEAISVAPFKGLDKAVSLAVDHKMIKEPLTEAQKKEILDIVYDPRS
jgi:NitT/TauT family transport system substrate-binding protein